MITYIKDKSCCKEPLKGKTHSYGVFCNDPYFSKLLNHVSDQDIHVTLEDKENWNNKASQIDLDDVKANVQSVKDQVSELKQITPNLDNYITKGTLNDYATQDYVRQWVEYQLGVKNFATTQYVKDYVSSTVDPQQYYTRSQIDQKISFLNRNYSITNVEVDGNNLKIDQAMANVYKTVELPTSSSASITQEQFDDMLMQSEAIKPLKCKSKSYYPNKQEVDITDEILQGGGGESSSNYYKPYFLSNTHETLYENEVPVEGKDPVERGWSEQPQEGRYVWITFAHITEEGFSTFTTPTRLTGKDGATYYRNPALRWYEFNIGDKYYDGTVADGSDSYHQDIVLYNNTYYICTNTQDGMDQKWRQTPNNATYFKPISATQDQFSALMFNSKDLVSVMSTAEVIAKDADTVVAGIVSGQTDSTYNKGNVRIFAGNPTNNNLENAPLTISNEGKFVSNGGDNKVMIENGILYVVTDGKKFHIQISATGSSLTWAQDGQYADVQKVQLYKLTNLVNDDTQNIDQYIIPSQVTLYMKKADGKYYTSETNVVESNYVNGNYFELQENISPMLAFAEDGLVLCGKDNDPNNYMKVQVYKIVKFKDGVRTNGNFIAIGRATEWYDGRLYGSNDSLFFSNQNNYYCKQLLYSPGFIGNAISTDYLYLPTEAQGTTNVVLQCLNDGTYTLDASIAESANPTISVLSSTALPNCSKEFSSIYVCSKKQDENTYVITKVTA